MESCLYLVYRFGFEAVYPSVYLFLERKQHNDRSYDKYEE